MTVVREIRRQCELETRRFHFSRITKSLWKTLAIRACTCGEQWRIGFFTSWHATCSTSSSHLGSGESKSTCEARHPRCGRRPQGDGLVFQRRFSNDTDQRCDETAPAVRSGGSRKPRVRRRGVGKSGEGLRAAQQAAAVPVCQPAKPVAPPQAVKPLPSPPVCAGQACPAGMRTGQGDCAARDLARSSRQFGLEVALGVGPRRAFRGFPCRTAAGSGPGRTQTRCRPGAAGPGPNTAAARYEIAGRYNGAAALVAPPVMRPSERAEWYQ